MTQIWIDLGREKDDCSKRKSASPDVAKLLLGSRSRPAVLLAFATRPTEGMYPRQLARETASPLATVQRELSRLERLGLLTAERRGKEKVYRIDELASVLSRIEAASLQERGAR